MCDAGKSKAFIFTVKEAEKKEDEINEIKMSENFPGFFFFGKDWGELRVSAGKKSSMVKNRRGKN